ncbi:hypothetical protein HK100_003060 [Physocladia obscura]|uniref:LicD/FKTN/FKRP nucleotidyltransferase domain-containing protein n=1 Tax=Physocladia obscura TaxID=109957 RepID=A0AAD5SUL4_9FUNG|nr:hypothetical protein HK100_003060 [Physocladia obscura]
MIFLFPRLSRRTSRGLTLLLVASSIVFAAMRILLYERKLRGIQTLTKEYQQSSNRGPHQISRQSISETMKSHVPFAILDLVLASDKVAITKDSAFAERSNWSYLNSSDRTHIFADEKITDNLDKTLIRLHSYDTDKRKAIPPSHFQLKQVPPPSLHNVSMLFEIGTRDHKYFSECGADQKLDIRFVSANECLLGTRKPAELGWRNLWSLALRKIAVKYQHDLKLVHGSLREMLTAWAMFAEEHNITWWIAHGEMLGWFWNAKFLPWDVDLDIQMSTLQMLQLVQYNHTLINKRFLIDVNPAFIVRSRQEQNTIDARIVDTRTGYMMDITALTQIKNALGKVSCKSPHTYSYSELMPLHETLLEGVKVWRPDAVMIILKEEYQESSMTKNSFLMPSSGKLYKWDTIGNRVIGIPRRRLRMLLVCSVCSLLVLAAVLLPSRLSLVLLSNGNHMNRNNSKNETITYQVGYNEKNTVSKSVKKPILRKPSKEQIIHDTPPAYIDFKASNLQSPDDLPKIYGPSNKEDALTLRKQCSERENDFSPAFRRFYYSIKRTSSYDLDTYLSIPSSHFSLYQPSSNFSAEADQKYFEECGRDQKLDKRFTAPENCVRVNNKMPEVKHNQTLVHESLVGILSAWSEYSMKNSIVWWISHGGMIGWYWTGKLLPWDLDLDIQMSTRQLVGLVAYNQTLIDSRYLIDVNPTFMVRTCTPSRTNTIDARVVDTKTGYLMDITALTQTVPSMDTISCKSPHTYHYNQLFPLVETMLDGVKVWRPRAAMAIIAEEYNLFALQRETFRAGNCLYKWNNWKQEWIKRSKNQPKIVTQGEKILLIAFAVFIFAVVIYGAVYMIECDFW